MPARAPDTTTHGVPYNPLAAPFDLLQECDLLRWVGSPYTSTLQRTIPHSYGLSTGNYRYERVDRVDEPIYHQGPQHLDGADITREFAEDAQFILGPCANSNIGGSLVPTQPFVGTRACEGSHLTIQICTCNTVVEDYNVSAVPYLQDPGSFSMTSSDSASSIGAITPTQHAPLQPAAQASLVCPFGCQGTFGRPGEYRRHMGKHDNPTFFCTQHGCTKSFYRKDKLKDHLRQGHGIAQPRRARRAAVIGAVNVAPTTGNQV